MPDSSGSSRPVACSRSDADGHHRNTEAADRLFHTSERSSAPPCQCPARSTPAGSRGYRQAPSRRRSIARNAGNSAIHRRCHRQAEYDSTPILVRYGRLQQQTASHYGFTSNAVITIAIRLRYDYDPTTMYRARLLPIRRKQKMNMSIFCRSRIVLVSQSNRAHIVISITSVVVKCVVVSSYRIRIIAYDTTIP